MMETSTADLNALTLTLERLEKKWVGEREPLWYDYMPLPIEAFLGGVHAALEHLDESQRNFIDLGCGIGTKIAVMHHLGWKADGVDHNNKYIESAKELVPEANLYTGDIRHIKILSEYDLIYMYRPAVHDDLEMEVEKYVLSCMSVGSIAFFANSNIQLHSELKEIYPHVGKKL